MLFANMHKFIHEARRLLPGNFWFYLSHTKPFEKSVILNKLPSGLPRGQRHGVSKGEKRSSPLWLRTGFMPRAQYKID